MTTYHYEKREVSNEFWRRTGRDPKEWRCHICAFYDNQLARLLHSAPCWLCRHVKAEKPDHSVVWKLVAEP